MARCSKEAPLAVVLHGEVPADAGPDEQDTLAQAAAISHALAGLGYETRSEILSLDLADAAGRLRRLRPAIVVNLVESIDGRGDLIHLAPALLAHLGLPYTGADAGAMLASTDKLFAKRLLREAGIPTPDWIEPRALADALPRAADRYIVKSVCEEASLGLGDDSVVNDGAALQAVLRDRLARFGGAWFAERFVDGREFNLSLLAGPRGPILLPPAEIDFIGFADDRPRIVDYAAKWHEESAEYRATPRRFDSVDPGSPLHRDLEDLALRCWRCFGLAGYARVDVRLDADGRPWVLEVNANPCLAPDAGFAAAAKHGGYGFETVVARIVEDGLARAAHPLPSPPPSKGRER